MSDTPITDTQVTNGEVTPKATLLFVDDEQNILSALRRLFRQEGYRILLASSAQEALSTLAQEAVDVVVSDMRMPEMDGAEFLKRVSATWPNTVRILLTGFSDLSSTVTAVNEGQIYRYVSKPWEDADLKLTVTQALERKFLAEERQRLLEVTRVQNEALAALNGQLENKVKARTAELEQMMAMLEYSHEELKNHYATTVKVFANLIEARERRVTGHGRRVAELGQQIALHLGMDEVSAKEVLFAGLLHDIGKIGLPDELIGKPLNTLPSAERAQLATHAAMGQAMLMALEPMQGVALLIRAHHERHDGKGYPDGLSGNAIPLGARILAVVNDYDALQIGAIATQRYSAQEALDLIVKARGQRYHPQAVDALLVVLGAANPEIDSRRATHSLRSGQLAPGMVLGEDLATKEGVLLLSRDYVLDEKLIQRIQALETALGTVFDIQIIAARQTSGVAGAMAAA